MSALTGRMPEVASRSREAAVIARLTGQIVEKQATRLVVDVRGVGYEVHVPLSTFYHLPEPGGEVTLRVHTHVREDAHRRCSGSRPRSSSRCSSA